jgi:hypothetical protein
LIFDVKIFPVRNYGGGGREYQWPAVAIAAWQLVAIRKIDQSTNKEGKKLLNDSTIYDGAPRVEQSY